MRRHILQLASIAVLLVVFGSYISELLDHWDHTLQTGNDIESVLVVLALTAGAVLAFAGTVAVSAAGNHVSCAAPLLMRACAVSVPLVTPAYSPPLLALRI